MRFIQAVKPSEANGLVAEVYGQIRKDFALLRDPDGNSPFMAHSPHAELLAAFWTVLYETVLVEGKIARADKEAIAATVSRANDCPFCVDAHSLLSGAAGDGADREALAIGATGRIADARRRDLVSWAAATREPESEAVRRPPFGADEAPEAIGTAVAFHYVNRIVTVFQGDEGMNTGPAPLRRFITPIVGQVAGRALRRKREPGRSLRLLPEAEAPHDLGWAAASPHIAGAFARFSATVEAAAETVLSESERASVAAAVEAWDGTDPPLGSSWPDDQVAGLDPRSLPTTRLALLAALAPYRVDTVAVDQFKRLRPHDHELVAAVAWSAFRAATRVGSWLHPTRERDDAVAQSS